MLGDRVKSALESVGLTEEFVQEWIGNCGCEERREKLNRLGMWASRVFSGRVTAAWDWLRVMMADG